MIAPAPDLRRRKIAVLGARSVGKSSLIVQYIENQFDELYYPTIERAFVKAMKYRGKEYDLEILDTAGQDEYSIFNAKHAIGAGIHGYVLVYSVASKKSFDMIQTVYDKIIDFCGVTDVPCVIVGSKSDLRQSRQLQPDEGQQLARSNNAAWIETSAKEDRNVGVVFELCLAEIEKRSAHNTGETDTTNRCCIQ
ncbi:hypothetical protein FISHEDRAFT_50189 [Fistulina hepatica ATCC 64428]|uniref:Rheb small monomeric GTPase RhbA n=1 Tax=Fistulina hepatica ATCC 64428 TaxID=1128425 RepID=A0A0D7A2M2_9AGAR|nr:hypothetical protein FISHEDRAFT_50189 [Fistulina hepatica ATCC 64428]